jgi:hypothetical protein
MLGIDDPLIWLAYIGCVAGGAAQRRLRPRPAQSAAGDDLTQEDRCLGQRRKEGGR